MKFEERAGSVLHDLLQSQREILVLVLRKHLTGSGCLLAFGIQETNKLQYVNNVAFIVRSDTKLFHGIRSYGARERLTQLRNYLRDVSCSGDVRKSCHLLAPLEIHYWSDVV